MSRGVVDRLTAEFGARVRRVAGVDRSATAVEVSRDLWGRVSGAPGDRFLVVNGQRTDAWAFGLAASPLSVRDDAPLLLVNDAFGNAEPTRYLRDDLAYRVDRAAAGTLVGPPTLAGTAAADAYARQRTRELLGG